MNQQYPSMLLEKAVGEFAKLPGVGRKTAMRLVLHLLRQDTAVVEAFGNAMITLKHEVKYCKVCHNISDTETCRICSNPARDASTICVVESIRDVMAVEATQQYRGLYHVLGGVISPMDGIGPSDLQIESLVERVKGGEVKEVILALSSTMEGDTTNFYISRKLDGMDVKLSVIARGISIGDELEYTDEVTYFVYGNGINWEKQKEMEKKIRQLLRYLQIEYVAVWVLPLLLVALYETGVMTEGAYAGDVRMDYVLQTVGILLAVGLIPLSLRLFSLSLVKNVKQRSLPEALKSYRRWSEIRTGMLVVPVLVNLSFYYLTLNNTGVLCAMMALIASLFCVPTRKRMLDELDLVKEENEEPAL